MTAVARAVGFIVVFGVLGYWSGDSPAQPAPSLPSAGPTALEIRTVADADSCPTAIEIWLTETQDTIVALEIYLNWDRPDFARFRKAQYALPPLDTLVDDTAAIIGGEDVDKKEEVLQPVVDRRGGLLENWEYVEARGESGLGVKVVALARVSEAPAALAIQPGDSGRLVALPLDVPFNQYRPIEHDSAAVRFGRMATRISTRRGALVDTLTLVPAYVPITPCWRSRASED
jgi:hypothetical protein